MNRRGVTTGLGTTGAELGVAAGLIQTTVGSGIPEWTGDKLANGALGLLTIALAAVAGLAALRQRDARLSVLSRAACTLALIGPGLVCLTTVGRLWYLPAALLTTAGGPALLMVVGGLGGAALVAAAWWRTAPLLRQPGRGAPRTQHDLPAPGVVRHPGDVPAPGRAVA
jgi:hypothetical protein